jgi:hypothetical protein
VSAHYAPERLLDFLADRLPETEEEALVRHVETCPDCEGRLRQLGEPGPPLWRQVSSLPSTADGALAARIRRAFLADTEPAPLRDPARWPRVPGYEVLAYLGEGGSAAVFHARDRRLNREVALKVVLGGSQASAAERQRFRREAELAARLGHPGIVQVYEVGEHDGALYLTLEYCRGGSLAARLRDRALPPGTAAAVVEKLARAVHHAHAHGVIHRDLKPSNVLLAEPDPGPPESWAETSLLKIADFGLARALDESEALTLSGDFLGTPRYTAPEQARRRHQEVGPAVDVHALGVILYELLTARSPFLAATRFDTLHRVVHEEPAPPSRYRRGLPRDLETICLRCLEKDPARRYPTAEMLADDLARFLAHQPIRSRRPGPVYRGRLWCRRNPRVAGLAALLLLTLAGGFAGILHQWRAAELARRDALASNAEAERLLGELIQFSPAAPLKTDYYLGGEVEPPPLGARLVVPDVPEDSSQATPDVALLLRAEAHCRSLLQRRPEDTRLRVTLTKLRASLAAEHDARWQTAEMAAWCRSARELWEAPELPGPPTPEARGWLATTDYWHAQAVRELGDPVGALRGFQRAYALWLGLAAEQPDNLEYLQKVAESRAGLSGLLRGTQAERARLLPEAEAEAAALEREVRADRGDPALRHRLALTCFLAGELQPQDAPPDRAGVCWQRAYEHYRVLTEAPREDLLAELSLAFCCCRLMRGQSADPHYAEAVARFDRVAWRVAARAGRHPDSDWLRDVLQETYRSRALCHWEANRPAEAAAAYQDLVRLVAERAGARPTDLKAGTCLLDTLLGVASHLREAGQSEAALARAREAAALASRYAGTPSRDRGFLAWLGERCLLLSAVLCQLGDAAEGLRQAEQGRRVLTALRHDGADQRRYALAVSDAWTWIGKARWRLGHAEEALAAFRESAEWLRPAYERAPSARPVRVRLSRCYDRLAYWSGLHGDRSRAAAALLEREKLWLEDAEQLREVARDFDTLAAAVAGGWGPLSVAEQAERQRYLDQADRLRRAAARVGGHAGTPAAPPEPSGR